MESQKISPTGDSAGPSEVQSSAQHPWALLWFIGLALLTFGLDVTLLNSSLPTVASVLNASPEEIQWFAGAYIALFNQNPMSVGYSGRPGESGFPGGCDGYPVGCVISLMRENS